MKISELHTLGFTCLQDQFNDGELAGGYTSDLLSDVMANLAERADRMIRTIGGQSEHRYAVDLLSQRQSRGPHGQYVHVVAGRDKPPRKPESHLACPATKRGELVTGHQDAHLFLQIVTQQMAGKSISTSIAIHLCCM